MAERWADIDGFKGKYQVSTLGRVRSIKTGHYRNMKLKHNRKTGYDFVILGYGDGSTRTATVHRLVAETFLPRPSGCDYVNHKDEDKANNTVGNLEWCTAKHNNEWSKHKKFKKVDVFTVDGEYLGTFASEKAAASVIGASKSSVSQAMSGAHHTCCGFVLRKAGD